MPLSGQANHAPIFDAGGNLDVNSVDLVSAANLEPVAPPFGSDLEGDRHFKGQIFSLARVPKLFAVSERNLTRRMRPRATAAAERPLLEPAGVSAASKTVAENLVE